MDGLLCLLLLLTFHMSECLLTRENYFRTRPKIMKFCDDKRNNFKRRSYSNTAIDPIEKYHGDSYSNIAICEDLNNVDNIINISKAKISDLRSIIALRIAVFYPAHRNDFKFKKDLNDKIRMRFEKGSICLIANKVEREPANQWNQGRSLKSLNSIPSHEIEIGSLVGTVELSDFDFLNTTMSGVESERKLYVADLAVRADSRRLGIATTFLQIIDEFAQRNGFRDIFLHVEVNNEMAIRLYTKNGYSIYPYTPEAVKFTENHLNQSAQRYLLLHKRQ